MLLVDASRSASDYMGSSTLSSDAKALYSFGDGVACIEGGADKVVAE